VAIRPEKVMMSKTPPAESRNCTKGIVREIAYLGDISIYYVELSSGKHMQSSLPNLLRLSERNVKWDDEVYLFWRAENGILLTV
jgi:putrescine transport system ATP-binding protein